MKKTDREPNPELPSTGDVHPPTALGIAKVPLYHWWETHSPSREASASWCLPLHPMHAGKELLAVSVGLGIRKCWAVSLAGLRRGLLGREEVAGEEGRWQNLPLNLTPSSRLWHSTWFCAQTQ